MAEPWWEDSASPAPTQWFAPGDASPWDTAYLAGQQVPGLVTVKGETSRKLDIKSAPGSDGATITHHGYQPAKLTMTVRLWTPAHWDAWQAILPAIAPKPGKQPSAPLDFAHPAANALGVRAVIVESVSMPEVKGQVAEVSVKMVQWLQPKKAKVTTPTASTSSANDFYQVDGKGKPLNGTPKAAPPATSNTYTNPKGG